tara:strand:- start:54 stop:653 length:600 start_codon:yes stop_codon:yes gene_type:complete
MANFWSIGGNKVSTLINGLPSGVDNDHGNVRAGGNVSDTTKFSADAVNLGISRYITVVSGVNGVEAPSALGIFNSGEQVIFSYTTKIAGISNKVLEGGSSNGANAGNSINQTLSNFSYQYKTAVRTGGWNEYSGVFSPAVRVMQSGYWSQATDTDATTVMKASGVDNAANPSQAIPGEFVYQFGSPTPQQADYKAKTNW